MTGTTGSSTGGSYYIYKDGTQVYGNGGGGGQPLSVDYKFDNLTSSNTIKFEYQGSSTTESPITFKIKMMTKGELIGEGCDNYGEEIGGTKFNENYNSPAYVGYMYNPDTLITYKANSRTTSGSLFGNGVSYSNGIYTLTNTSTTYDNNHHYTCNNTSGTCSIVRYYYCDNYYTELSDGRDITQALNDMLKSDNVNKTNSTIKTTIDNWYQTNLSMYSDKLEDTIFCNDRSILNLGGWNPNGGSKTEYLQFKNYNEIKDLSCENVTDQFSVANPKAKLTYKVGLMSAPEMNLLNNNNIRKTGQVYWLVSPSYFAGSFAYVRYVKTSGALGYNYVSNSNGARPAVSLAAGTTYSEGDGSIAHPYVIN